MRAAWALGLLAFGVACNDGGGLVSSDVSPLTAVDDDRLWILLQAARVNPRCGLFYAPSQDPRITGLAVSCAAFEQRAIAWFEANGVAIASKDIRDPELWHRFSRIVAEIGQCVAESRDLPVAAEASLSERSLRCDPYDRIIRVDKKTLQQSGFRAPPE